MNEIQFIGSHNSYKKAIDPALLAQIESDNKTTAMSLDYAHRPLSEQLDIGLRKVELDIFYDPEGGMYASPLGVNSTGKTDDYDPGAMMKKPGFKTLHVQDIDFRTHCYLFEQCLRQIVEWSDAHPEHLPIFITINAKDDVIDRPGFVRPLKFNEKAWQALDEEIRRETGERLLTPDDVRGDHETLREAVLAGWPRVNDVRGRILFVLDDGAAKKQSYVKGHPSLRGRAMFVDMPEDTDEASIRIVNDPLTRLAYIQDLVRQGFIVRTRADADTKEARIGDVRRRDAAFRSGAQIVSTDYYVEDQRFETGYLVSLPQGSVARCNELLVSRSCVFSDLAD